VSNLIKNSFLFNFKEIKNNFLRKENIFYFFIIILIFFFDRISKQKIIFNLNETIYFYNDYINFNLIWNIGIGFGLLSTNSILLYNLVTTVIGVIILILIYCLILSKSIDKLIYALILGGALGNFYDRLIYQAVPDFIDLHYNNFHWFTFNVADIFITMGIIIFVLNSFFDKNLKK
tara:strand:+ start:962 stop:1489 length:528 start_codon:yes stop_codon:yes gene_type:complete